MDKLRDLTIFLTDDHSLVAKGIAKLIEQIIPGVTVAIFKNGSELLQACQEKESHLIFLDYEMPLMNGIQVLTQLKSMHIQIPVVMLSMLSEKAVVDKCLAAGALGFINKDSSEEEFKSSVLAALRGEIYLSREIMQAKINQTTERQYHLLEPLSEREMEILKLFCDGFSPKEISDKCHLSIRTVEKHKENIMQKMEVHSVAKMISNAYKFHLLS
jgi:DNA-binding NarL/FixJ family response regulator